MFHTAIAIAALTLFAVPSPAEEKRPTVLLHGSVADKSLEKEAPGVIVSQKGYEKLVKAWGIKDAPKVNFDKEILVVGTTIGSHLHIITAVDDKGDLKVQGISTADI